MARGYRLGKRQASVDRTAEAIAAAARRLVEEGAGVSVGAVARRAGVSRITVYNRFGSRAGLLRALAPAQPASAPDSVDPRDAVRHHVVAACARWAANPALYRHLPATDEGPESQALRRLAEGLAAADVLRPGCSLREAEDVLGVLGLFAVFDRLFRDGRRTPSAVAEILMRLAGAILA